MQRTQDRAREALGEDAFGDAWTAGAGRTVAEAGHRVLEELATLEARLSVR
jgi:hypothetical protein